MLTMDKDKYVFIPCEKMYEFDLKCIFTLMNMGTTQWQWANKGWFIGLFEVEWKKPKHHLLVEFFNIWRKNDNKLKTYARIGDKVHVYLISSFWERDSRSLLYRVKGKKVGKKNQEQKQPTKNSFT